LAPLALAAHQASLRQVAVLPGRARVAASAVLALNHMAVAVAAVRLELQQLPAVAVVEALIITAKVILALMQPVEAH